MNHERGKGAHHCTKHLLASIVFEQLNHKEKTDHHSFHEEVAFEKIYLENTVRDFFVQTYIPVICLVAQLFFAAIIARKNFHSKLSKIVYNIVIRTRS